MMNGKPFTGELQGEVGVPHSQFSRQFKSPLHHLSERAFPPDWGYIAQKEWVALEVELCLG